MAKTEPQLVDDSAIAYVQGTLTPDENTRFEAVVDRMGFKKGAFVSMAVMERVAMFEKREAKRSAE